MRAVPARITGLEAEVLSLAAPSVHRPLMVHSLVGRVVPDRHSGVGHILRRQEVPVALVGHSLDYPQDRLLGTGLMVPIWADQ